MQRNTIPLLIISILTISTIILARAPYKYNPLIKEDKKEITANIIEKKPIIKDQTTKDITVIDKSIGQTCLQSIEYFFEDETYKYYFNCIKSNQVIVRVNNNEYTLKEALQNKIVTIKELNNAGYYFNKELKLNKH